MFEVKKYKKSDKHEWDSLIQRSKNGAFLFYRDYMDYHEDRFNDNSLMIYRKEKLEAVLPGNSSNSIFYSHQGLTYGGLIQSTKLCTKDVLTIFELVNEKLRKAEIIEVIYKPIPLIYHIIPSQEDIYALFKLGALKIGCNLSSTIYQNSKIKFIESRKSGIRKSVRAEVKISESNRFDLFWPILNTNLEQNHGTKAVHTLNEIVYLQQIFPNNIKLFLANQEEKIVAGTVLYIMNNIVHVQYMSANKEGKSIGALDLLFDEIINKRYSFIPMFDFGHSNEEMGMLLNEQLIFQKEGFGGRGVVYEIYQYSL